MWRIVGWLCAWSIALLPVSGSAIWFGDNRGVHRVDAATGRIDLEIPSDPPVALAIDGKAGSAWALTQGQIVKYGRDGTILFSASLGALVPGLGTSRLLALDPRDGSVWLAGEKRLARLAPSGARLVHFPVSVEDMSVAQDGTLWVLLQGELRRYAPDGASLQTTPLSAADQKARYLALDDPGGFLWLAGEKQLTRHSLSDPAAPTLELATVEPVSALSIDIQTGALWLIGQQSLFGYARDGTRFLNQDLRAHGIANPQSLVFDFTRRALWVGHQQGLSRLDLDGAPLATLPAAAKSGTVAIGRLPIEVTPTLQLIEPEAGALLNDPQPTLTFRYGARCAGQPCGFPNDYFAAYSLSALLNGSAIGALFLFDRETGSAHYTPPLRLPEGANQITAHVTDGFGRRSETLTAPFVIDTVAPRFLSLTPVSGSVFSSAEIAIGGQVDDPAAQVRLAGNPDETGPTFSFPLTLRLGTNLVTLTATDPAGNATSEVLTYTYEPPNALPSVTLTSPANGVSFASPATITVSAQAVDSDGTITKVEFFRNGTSFGTDTSAPYTASLTVNEGAYALTAIATDNRGGKAGSEPVHITVGPPNSPPTVSLTYPESGTTFTAPATLRLAATAADSDGSIDQVEFLRNGVPVGTAGTAPYVHTLSDIPAGRYTLTARAVDDKGATALSAPIDIEVKALGLSIISPAAEARIEGDSVLVTGSIQAPANSGVHVNGVTAALDGQNRFFALVPLSPGSNTLTATLTAPEGQTLTQTVTVTATGSPLPFFVSAEPEEGLAPLPVTFTVSNPTAQAATYTFDGFGPFALPANGRSVLRLTYPAGVFTPTVVVTDGAGGTTTQRLLIEALDETALDQKLRALWKGMNDALLEGDKVQALAYLNAGAKKKYGPVFDVLLPHMSDIVASYSPLAKSSLNNVYGEYAVKRQRSGQSHLYFIYFLRDFDGVWRIDEM